MMSNFHKNEHLANIYYAYDWVHRYLEEPFTSQMPEGLFNISKFILNEIVDDKPKGVSLLYPLLFCDLFTVRNKCAKTLII